MSPHISVLPASNTKYDTFQINTNKFKATFNSVQQNMQIKKKLICKKRHYFSRQNKKIKKPLNFSTCVCSLITYHNVWFWNFATIFYTFQLCLLWYTRVNKNPSAWNFLSPKPEVTCGTVAIIIRVVLLSPYLRIRVVSLSSIHYNQSHSVYINRRRQYICLIWN